MIIFLRKHYKVLASFLVLNFIHTIISPIAALALTSGPNSPEFSSFEPVATTDMVNTFTGGFTYNLPVLSIPGPDGAGYAMSLSYHSGVGSEEEASWVGYGWTLNPGAINRQVSGYPDDYMEAPVTQYNKSKPNFSASTSVDFGLEFFSADQPKGKEGTAPDTDATPPATTGGSSGASGSSGKQFENSLGGLSFNSSIRFNNYNGFVRTIGYGLNVKGVSMGLSHSAGETTFSFNVNPVALINSIKDAKKKNETDPAVVTNQQAMTKKEKYKQDHKALYKSKTKQKLQSGLSNYTSAYGIHSQIGFSSPVAVSAYKGASFNWSGNASVHPAWSPVGIEMGFSGNFNVQANEPEGQYQANGYMYNSDYSSNTGGVLSDYTVERDNPFDRRDYYLGIPFSNADQFIMTGEAIAGGFRYYYDKLGYFYPNTVESNQNIQQMGVEFSYGPNLGIGFDFGLGFQWQKMNHWLYDSQIKPDDNSADHTFGKTGFFRFSNDMGGSLDYSTALGADVPKLTHINEFDDLNLGSLQSDDKGRSSNVVYNKYTDNAGATEFNLFEQNDNIKTFLDGSTNEPRPNGSVREIMVYNETGQRYVYGLPVYSQNEKSLTFGVKPSAEIENRNIVYQDVNLANPADEDIVVGEVRNEPYASNYLLTQINTFDYVDNGAPGAGPEDFGGWTKFDYKRLETGSTPWYQFRTPYEGLTYNQNSISNQYDDMGGIVMGEKQVYYLKAIETKSHVAFFVTNKSEFSDFEDYFPPSLSIPSSVNTILTGSGNSRCDGIDASDVTGKPNTGSNGSAKGDFELERLEKIVLFSKERLNGKPLQVTNFEYSYDLVPGIPNKIDGGTCNGNNGKLTLEKVWFEREGVYKSQIAPYKFDYHYPKQHEFSAEVWNRYGDILDEDAFQFDVNAQNPMYKPYALDCWGNYQYNGDKRSTNMQPWVKQVNSNPTEFDPAAWQLKQITLPSGGRIIVQYEQNDYTYVQDRPAMAMVSLINDASLHKDTYDPKDNKYYINLDDIGLDINNSAHTATIDDLVDQLYDYFEDEKIYFKYLYALKNASPSLDASTCKSEYITGYAQVVSVQKDAHGVFFKLGDDNPGIVNLVQNRTEVRKAIPRQICYDYVVANKGGLLDADCSNKFSLLEANVQTLYNAGLATLVGNNTAGGVKLRPDVARPAIKLALDNFFYNTEKRDNVCKKLNYQLSYLRIPLLVRSKLGGGIRVKRLLMYDPGIETGDANLYGSEYIYKLENGLSSGVATNEPAAGREENPLVNVLARGKQSTFGRIIAGRDKEQMEGPIGESILPAPAVGYSRVVTRNIHQGKTANGYLESTFYTVFDYAYDKVYQFTDPANPNSKKEIKGLDYTDLKDNRKRIPVNLPLGLINYKLDFMSAGQGYAFVINSMHGQPKSIKQYAGKYVSGGNEIGYGGLNTLVSSTVYEYYEPGEEVRILENDGNRYYSVWGSPGKEEDVTAELKQVEDMTLDISLELDVTVNIQMPPVFFVTFMPSVSFQHLRLNTLAKSKVIRYPTISKRVTQYQDGITHVTENLVFSRETGQPVATRTYDSYNDVNLYESITGHQGKINSLTIPGSYVYADMGQTVKNAGYSNQLNLTAANITTYSDDDIIDAILNGTQQSGGWTASALNSFDNQVLSASIQTYSKTGWFADNDMFREFFSGSSADASIAIAALSNVYRPLASYVYKSNYSALASTSTNKIYNSGFYESFNPFDFTPNALNLPINGQGWIKASEITKYSPHGMPLEEIDALNIKSSVQYGYKKMLPVMVAKNAAYPSILFESFEDANSNLLGLSTDAAHSGSKCLDYITNPGYLFAGANQAKKLVLDDNLINHGASIKLWIKTSKLASNNNNVGNSAFNLNINGQQHQLNLLAQVGEWGLYYVDVFNWGGLGSGQALSIKLNYNALAGERVFVDDFRFQPYESEAQCTVYDFASLRVLAQFDDQHFGVFYQYDSEGKLTRQIIETERGLRTLKETYYNNPDESR